MLNHVRDYHRIRSGKTAAPPPRLRALDAAPWTEGAGRCVLAATLARSLVHVPYPREWIGVGRVAFLVPVGYVRARSRAAHASRDGTD